MLLQKIFRWLHLLNTDAKRNVQATRPKQEMPTIHMQLPFDISVIKYAH